MNRIFLLIALIGSVALTPSRAPATEAGRPIRIMPLGDSITEARNGQASYRYWLWGELIAHGYDVDFVGSRQGVFEGRPRYDDFDPDHEGHWGWHADEVLDQVADWTRKGRPDVVLIHLGTNDLGSGEHPANTLNDLCQIIKTLQGENPDVTVLLAKLIPAVGIDVEAAAALNKAIAALAGRRNIPASRVVAVDMTAGFDVGDDTYDGLHPNEAGEKKMAGHWLAALQEVLGPPPGRLSSPGF